jgi:N-acetyl-gamma-glutamyl-phosphate/LysW-gamma-L-alpha-aminoadipyl-6-phosphate reductase
LTAGPRIPVGVVGASGYGGAETARWLLRHPRFALAAATARRAAGKRLAEVHEFLEGATDLVVTDEEAAAVARRVEALVFALPHGEAARLVPAALDANPSVRIVDLSGDFRLDDAKAWEAAYGMPHPAPALLPRFVYGFTEAHRAAIGAAQCVANPGCFATAVEAALFPLAARGLLHGEAVVFAATGSSGSGAEPGAGTHHPERDGDFRAYKVLDHQHVPEIERLLRESGAENPRVSLVPHSGPFVRGIFATCTALLDPPADAAALEGLLREVYAGEPFVRVRKGTPRVGVVEGTNFVDLAVHARGPRAVVLAALDNLGKGMASQAVQNLNRMFGIPETEGLLDFGRRP